MLNRNHTTKTPIPLLIATGFSLLSGEMASAAKSDWAEGTAGIGKGATREFYNAAGSLQWKHFMGDWADARGAAQGAVAYASATVTDDDKVKAVDLDVTKLAAEWIDGTHPNKGFFIRAQTKGNTLKFASREAGEKYRHPTLKLVGDKNSITLAPVADTFLDESTYRSQGNKDELMLSGGNSVLLQF